MSDGVYIILPEAEKQKFARWVQSLKDDSQRELNEMLINIRNRMIKRMHMFAPRRYGFLAGSIRPATSGTMIIAVEAGGRSNLGALVNYAPYVEFGTGRMVKIGADVSDYAMQFKGQGKREVNNRAQPYFFPSVRLAREELMQKLKQMGFK